MESKKRETIGKISRDMQLKQPDSVDPIEIERVLHQEYEKNIFECVDKHKKEFIGSFFIVVDTKKEPLMHNVLRNYFIGRVTCPTPNYDQTVYRYDRSIDKLDFLWVIPDRGTCFYLKDHALEVVAEEKDLLDFVLSFDEGDLLRACKKFNGETPDSTLIIS